MSGGFIYRNVNLLVEAFGKNTPLATKKGLKEAIETVYLNASGEQRANIRDAYKDENIINFDALGRVA